MPMLPDLHDPAWSSKYSSLPDWGHRVRWRSGDTLPVTLRLYNTGRPGNVLQTHESKCETEPRRAI